MKRAGLLVVLIWLGGAGVGRAAVAPPLVRPTSGIAQVRLGKHVVVGQRVSHDVSNALLRMDGMGALQLECGPVLEGQKGRLTVHWDRHLNLSGPAVEVVGRVQAEQGNVRLTCGTLSLELARPLWLPDGQPDTGPAVVRRLTGTDLVLEHAEREGGRVVRFRRVRAKEGDVRCDEGALILRGPGSHRLAEAEGGAFHLTHLEFDTRLRQANGTLFAQGNVLLVEMPVKGPAQQPDLTRLFADTLPEGTFYLRADRMTVRGAEVEASGRVFGHGRTFYAWAETARFDRKRGLLILEGGGNGFRAVLQVVRPGNGPFDRNLAERILFDVRSNAVQLIGAGRPRP
jgi:hypothetical protein